MCGICGFISLRDGIPETVLLEMNARIVRRGPDGSGHFHEGPIGLAMRRLAIIDLAGRQQPIFNETGTIAIVFNGEIYNYRKLRDRLVQQGHQFRTDSDTEVIVYLYEQYGLDAPAHLAGMFAFAIWDSEKKLVVLAPDPEDADLKPKARSTVTAKMARIVYALIKNDCDYQQRFELALPSGSIPLSRAVEAIKPS